MLYFPGNVFPLDAEAVPVPEPPPIIPDTFASDFDIATVKALIAVLDSQDDEITLDQLLLRIYRAVSDASVTASGSVEFSVNTPIFTELEEDLADIIIAIMVLAGVKEFNLGAALHAKILHLESEV